MSAAYSIHDTAVIAENPSSEFTSCQQPQPHVQSALSEYPSRVRNAASGLFNHVLYGKWRQKPPHFFKKTSEGSGKEKNSIIWLLGRPYILEENDRSAYTDFLVDFRSRIWLSYREGFPPLLNSQKVSDCGWGCMLRCAQMMLAQALVLWKLDRDWCLGCSWINADLEPIIRLFEDCDRAPLSIHNLLRIAAKRTQNSGVSSTSIVGRWYTPSEAVSLMRDAVHRTKGSSLLANARIHLSTDMNVIVDEVVELSDNWRNAVFLTVSVRLGTKHINKTYYDQLKSLFSIEQCCGLIGGQPKRAFYFIGCEDDRLYYLDPHTVQRYQPLSEDSTSLGNQSRACTTGPEPVVQSNEHEKTENDTEDAVVVMLEDVNNKFVQAPDFRDDTDSKITVNKKIERKWMSFHSWKALSLPLHEVDPSCAIGFLFRTQRDFDSCIEDLILANVIEYNSVNGSSKAGALTTKTPIFTVFDTRDWLTSGNYRKNRSQTVDDDGFEIV